jgi:hypothetical protein
MTVFYRGLDVPSTAILERLGVASRMNRAVHVQLWEGAGVLASTRY